MIAVFSNFHGKCSFIVYCILRIEYTSTYCSRSYFQNLGRKQTTLYDIRDELFGLYKERRKPYRSLTIEGRFRLLTGETAETLEVGRLIMCTVSGIVRKKPTGELLDNANAIMRSDQTNLYQCPFCMVGVFQDLSAVSRFIWS